jgi:hypothetical protein
MTNQSLGAIAIGYESGLFGQGTYAIAHGFNAGRTNQGSYAIAMGYNTGMTSQGAYSICIGNSVNNTFSTGIALNGSNVTYQTTTAGFFANPIRNAYNRNTLSYNTTTYEITYGSPEILSIIFPTNDNVNVGATSFNIRTAATTNNITYTIYTLTEAARSEVSTIFKLNPLNRGIYRINATFTFLMNNAANNLTFILYINKTTTAGQPTGINSMATADIYFTSRDGSFPYACGSASGYFIIDLTNEVTLPYIEIRYIEDSGTLNKFFANGSSFTIERIF